MTGEDDDLKLVIAHTIIEDLRVQHPGIEQIDNERGDVWLPGGSTPQSSGCIIDVHSLAQSVEREVRVTLTPGHTDLMISPEAIDAFLDANPAPEPERDGAVERLRNAVAWSDECEQTGAVVRASDLRHVLSLLEEARVGRDRALTLASTAHANKTATERLYNEQKSRAETAERQRDEAVRAIWQPMSEAPRDGTKIVVINKRARSETLWWDATEYGSEPRGWIATSGYRSEVVESAWIGWTHVPQALQSMGGDR